MIAGASPSAKRTLPVRSPWISCGGRDRAGARRARAGTCLTSGMSRAPRARPRPRDRRSPTRRLFARGTRAARPGRGRREDGRRPRRFAQRRSSCRPSSHVLEGRHEERRWGEIVAVGDRLHAALAPIERPAFLELRADVWEIGDRVAWGELEARDIPEVKHLPAPPRGHCDLPGAAGLDAPRDLTGNVLFGDGLAPAIIELVALLLAPAAVRSRRSSWPDAPAPSGEGAERVADSSAACCRTGPSFAPDAYLPALNILPRRRRPASRGSTSPLRPDDADPFLPGRRARPPRRGRLLSVRYGPRAPRSEAIAPHPADVPGAN